MDTLKVKRITGTAQLPTKAHDTDAGYDVYADEDVTIKQGSRAKVRLGVALDLPLGSCAIMYARSGLSAKQGTIVLAQVIDAGYTGEIHMVAVNHGDGPWQVRRGDKVAQIVVTPLVQFSGVEEVKKIKQKDRGAKGFGSTGV